jgi:hypothetical protein
MSLSQIERIDDFIVFAGCVTKWDDHELSIGNFNARMSEARRVYPIKRAVVKRKTPNRYGDKPIHYVYYYDRDRVIISDNEEVIRWLDEDEQIS